MDSERSMLAGFPRLLGDIGGTHARWAWQTGHGAPVGAVDVMRCSGHASLLDAAGDYLARHRHPPPRWACFGIATPVTGDDVRMTNHPWAFSVRAFRDALGLQRCLVINDFTAMALSLPALERGDLRALGSGPQPAAAATAPLALLGPGTGLGVSGLLPCDGRWLALAGEGGHVTLAAADDEEADVLARLRQRFDHVSAERVLSGAGLVALVDAVGGGTGPGAGAGAEQPLTPADVVERARSGLDPYSTRAVQLFAAFLGSVAGNLALTLGARGGVYVGGGVVPRMGETFDAGLFRRRFESKGRFAAYLQPIPTWLITAAVPALLGAARALDLDPRDFPGHDSRA